MKHGDFSGPRVFMKQTLILLLLIHADIENESDLIDCLEKIDNRVNEQRLVNWSYILWSIISTYRSGRVHTNNVRTKRIVTVLIVYSVFFTFGRMRIHSMHPPNTGNQHWSSGVTSFNGKSHWKRRFLRG